MQLEVSRKTRAAASPRCQPQPVLSSSGQRANDREELNYREKTITRNEAGHERGTTESRLLGICATE